MQANPGLDPLGLQIGQEIVVPAPGTGGEATVPTESRVVNHTVQAGETLLGIAAEYSVTLNDIYALNAGVSPQLLQVGQVLRIDLGPPTPTPTRTPLPTATPFPYPPPVPLWPRDGEAFEGAGANILLQWVSVGALRKDEWYEVRLWRGGEALGAWRTKAPSWRVPSEVHSASVDSWDYRW